MFRTVWSKTLRDYRIAILGWGIGLALLSLYGLAGYAAAVNTPAARKGVALLARSFTFFGEPVAITTPAGYATWKTLGFIPLVLAIWTLLAGAGLTRSEEERGSLDILLATPQSRPRILLQKIGAMAAALALIGCFIALGALLGGASAHAPVSLGAALLTGLNVSLTAFFFGMLALALSQFLASRSAAAGVTGALLAMAYLLDGTGRVVPDLQWAQRLTPFFYYNLSKPLIPSYGVNAGALAVTLLASLALAAVSVPLFMRRDLGEPFFTFTRNRAPAIASPSAIHALDLATRNGWLRSVSLRAFQAQGVSVFWWIIGIAGYAAWATSVARSTEDALKQLYTSSPAVAQLFQSASLGSDTSVLALLVFTFTPILSVSFALALAMGWVNDLERGRLEAVLSAPLPRWRVALERFSAALVAIILAPLVTWLAILLSAKLAGISDTGQLVAAAFGVIPLEVIVLAFVYLLAGRLSASVIFGVVVAILALSFFAEFLQSILKLPSGVIALSIFHQYGAPLTAGPQWGGWLALVGLAIVFLVLGVIQFSRSDLDRGA